jgi:hypothetical protein
VHKLRSFTKRINKFTVGQLVVDNKKPLSYNRYIMKLQNSKQSMQHTVQAVMSAYWSVNCAPAMFSNPSNLDRGTEIKSRVREGWDD